MKHLLVFLAISVTTTFSQVKISELPETDSVTGSGVVPFVQEGVTKQLSLDQIAGFVTSAGEIEVESINDLYDLDFVPTFGQLIKVLEGKFARYIGTNEDNQGYVVTGFTGELDYLNDRYDNRGPDGSGRSIYVGDGEGVTLKYNTDLGRFEFFTYGESEEDVVLLAYSNENGYTYPEAYSYMAAEDDAELTLDFAAWEVSSPSSWYVFASIRDTSAGTQDVYVGTEPVVTIDLSEGAYVNLAMQYDSGDVEVVLSNAIPGVEYTLEVISGMEPRKLTFPYGTTQPNGGTNEYTPDAGGVDILSLKFNGSKFRIIGVSPGHTL